MRSRTIAIVAGCALAAVTLTGCKSSTTSATGGGTTPPAASQTTPATQDSTPADQTSAPTDQSSTPATSGGGADDGLGHPVAVCTLLPVATVAQLSSESLVNAKEIDLLPDAKSYGCLYTDTLGTGNVGVSVLAKNAATSFNTGLTFTDNHAKPINGVGDKAYSGAVGVSALFGNVEISVTGLNNDVDAAVKIIQTLQPQL